MKGHRGTLDEELGHFLAGSTKVVVAGIGNAIRRDDYVGVRIVSDLQNDVPPSVHIIECETVPESFMDEIVEIGPTHVLMIDAALLGLEPGDAHLYDVDEVLNVPTISTHTLPLRVFCEYVQKLTGAKIALLLVEPKDTEFGEGLTPELEASAQRTIRALRRSLA
ncbi:MAG: hydrogenase 3 maturation protease [Methanomassiliicoccales archaeon PtaU1.Bin124]|nr:MAG: hydrogenase 3 maturation protease [Methanomassiliicoccales archaeon PtaU1.Bin124]